EVDRKDKSFAGSIEPVGSYPPNPLGLYDMMGNGFDWINDWYDADYYKISPEDNPTGPVKGDKKVLRGSGGASYWSNLVILRFSDKGNGKEGRKEGRKEGPVLVMDFAACLMSLSHYDT
ncbi:SUMF1/EgtB/PvdO family nonheme iron enzyme, partial [Escherichia coli]|nr:SUMF1/EgtB/PvdO family nonheme iron enzyme [Escherichia coli]